MFPSDLRARKEWFLPLVGGAEINRIKGKALDIMHITSRPYPAVLRDDFTGHWVTRDAFMTDLRDKFTAPLPAIIAGAIISGYNGFTTDTDKFTRANTFITGGELKDTTTIYTTLSTITDGATFGPSKISGGTLVQTTFYITYTNWVPDKTAYNHPHIISGTLV